MHRQLIQPCRGWAEQAQRFVLRHNAVGVEDIRDLEPRVAAAPQPWAMGQNRFAVHFTDGRNSVD
jgi:hypothetical protein